MGLGAKRDLEPVRRLILAKRSASQKLGWAILAIVIPAVLRWLLDRGADGFPFVTFFPAVVLAAVFLDWRFAGLVVVGAAVCSVRLFQTDVYAMLPIEARLLMGLLYFATAGALILIGATLRNALAELDQLSTAPGERARLTWQESLGPPVAPPTRTGFGSRLLNTLPAAMRVDRRFEPTGVICDIIILAPA